MGYTFASHLREISGGNNQPALGLFGLVDAARFGSNRGKASKLLPQAPTEILFEDSFARSALHLSPLVIEVSGSGDSRIEQACLLNRACSAFPMLTFIRSRWTLTGLVSQLRSVLLIEAERIPYLLRFADTQMMAAANAVFTPSQRSAFFEGIEAWFTIDHAGLLGDAADSRVHMQAPLAADKPILLDDVQTTALIHAVAVPVLASQLRNLDSSFAANLTHVQQTAFAADCVAEAGVAADEGSALVSAALQRWQLAAPRP